MDAIYLREYAVVGFDFIKIAHPFLILLVGGVFIGAFSAAIVQICSTSPKDEKVEEDEEDIGASTDEITSAFLRTVNTFPVLSEAYNISDTLPDMNGAGTTPVKLLLLHNDHANFEEAFGDHLIAIKRASEEKPNRTKYMIRLENCNRDIMIHVTSETNSRSVVNREKMLMLNEFAEAQTIALWVKKYSVQTYGSVCNKHLKSEEAWRIALRLEPGQFDDLPFDDLKTIADGLDTELIEIYNRV